MHGLRIARVEKGRCSRQDEGRPQPHRGLEAHLPGLEGFQWVSGGRDGPERTARPGCGRPEAAGGEVREPYGSRRARTRPPGRTSLGKDWFPHPPGGKKTRELGGTAWEPGRSADMGGVGGSATPQRPAGRPLCSYGILAANQCYRLANISIHRHLLPKPQADVHPRGQLHR